MPRSIVALILTAAATTAVLRYRTAPVKTSTAPSPTTTTSTEPLLASPATVPPSATSTVDSSTTTTMATTTTAAPTTTTVKEQVVTGPAEVAPDPGTSYRYGLVQLRVSFRGSTMTAVDPIQLPPDGDTAPPSTYQVSKSDSDYAAPILEKEALQAQSAQIQVVSGATYTSDAFISSLKAAINQVRG